MKAVLLAAGEGIRMRPLTYTRPKVMLPLVNRPLLEHLMLSIIDAGITDFIFLVGYHEEQVQRYFGDGRNWHVKIEYCIQRKQLGTADAIRAVEGQVDGNFLVINGDNIMMSDDIARIAANIDTILGIVEVENTKGLGSVLLDGDRVASIIEKTEKTVSELANAGAYLFTPAIFNAISRIPKSPRGEYEITDALQLMINEGSIIRFHKMGYWLNLSYPWDLLTANEFFLKNLEPQNQGQIEPNVTLKEPVSVGKGTVVHSGAYIVGPVIIGQDCDIGPNCHIRPFTAIGNHCHIGAAVEIKNSIVMQDTKIPHHNYIGDSVIGEGCNFGSGTKIANLRLDNRNVSVNGIDTCRHKLGAIIGDHVKTGINASIDVGSLIGNNSYIGPGATVHSIISPNSRIN